MASKSQDFTLSGPLHLTSVNWKDLHHRRSVAASLVQGVYVLEYDRQKKRLGGNALASTWWEFFCFYPLQYLVDDVDQSIFGAIYEFKPLSPDLDDRANGSPRYVIAFRGTINEGKSFPRDFEIDIQILQNKLHHASRFKIAMQAVRNMVASASDLDIWLAGHSLGSSIAMLAGKEMAKAGTNLESFLFNPPFVSAPIQSIKNKELKHGLRIASSLITAGLSIAVRSLQHQRRWEPHPFGALSTWVPSLFVNSADHVSAEYIGYFEHRKKMEEVGAGSIERVATQNSIWILGRKAMGKESESESELESELEPLHVIPSAVLTINWTRLPGCIRAHEIHQWWRTDLNLQSKLYRYS